MRAAPARHPAPELAACKGVKKRVYHTHDVYGHTLRTVA